MRNLRNVRIPRIVKSWTLWYALALLGMPLLLLAEPATQPAGAAKEKQEEKEAAAERRAAVRQGLPMDGVVKLPDGRELNLQDLQAQGVGMVMVRADMGDGKEMTITEDDRTITINENDEEIVVSIKEGDGEPTEYRAPTAEELEKNHPEAYEVYKKYAEDFAVQLPPPGMGGVGQQFRVAVGHGHGPFGGMTKVEALGASCMPVMDEFVRAQLGDGVVVFKVAKDSAGARVGLQRHDLIKSVNGKDVQSLEDVEEALDGAEKIKLEVLREGKPVTLSDN